MVIAVDSSIITQKSLMSLPGMDTPVNDSTPKAGKRLSRKLTKRFSVPTPMSKKEGKRSSITSTFSLPIFPRSSLAPDSVTGSNFTPPSITTTPISSASSSITRKPPPNFIPPPQTTYDPFQNYLPCLDTHCSIHYLPSTLLGPTYFLSQQPYNLQRKRGLCPSHATKDLRNATAACKKEYESMRQKAGRKTLRMIDAEFDTWVQSFHEVRSAESAENEKIMAARVLGPLRMADGGKQSAKGGGLGDQDWDWRYSLRICTQKNCTSDPYSVFDRRFFLWYSTARRSGLSVLSTLCPVCARRNIDEVERCMAEQWQNIHPQQWRDQMEELKRDRAVRQEFWEKAQERRVREPGFARGGRSNGDEDHGEGEGKGGNLLENLCVVM